MADDPAREAEVEFLDNLYNDPIREPAMKAGRGLVIGSLLLIAVARFGAKVQSSALFPISFNDRPDVLPTVLSILIVILVINFLGRVTPDILRYREVGVRIMRFVHQQRVANARERARSIDDAMADSARDDEYGPADDWWEDVGTAHTEAQAAIAKLESRLGSRVLPRAFRFVRAAGEVLIPLTVAFIALWEGYPLWRW